MPSSPEQIKDAQEKVKELVRKGDFGGAIAILRAIDHPRKNDWIAQIEAKRSDREFSDALNEMPPTKTGRVKTAPVARQQHGCVYRFVRGLAIGALVIFGCIAWFFTQNGGVFTGNSPIAGIATEMMSIEPKNVTINDNGTTLGRDFLPVLRRAVADYGYINGYGATVNAESRLLLEVDIYMVYRYKNRQSSHLVDALVLKTYALNIPAENQGSIDVGAFYEVKNPQGENVSCGDVVGAGYRVIQSLADWQNASNDTIFRLIDRDHYGDRGEHYGDLAFGINPPPAIGVCKE